MTVRWAELKQPFQKAFEGVKPLELMQKSLHEVDNKIEEFISAYCKPQQAHICSTALRAMPFIVAGQYIPMTTQLTGAAIALATIKNNSDTSLVSNFTIRNTHALALAFFMNWLTQVSQSPLNIFSPNACMNAILTTGFLKLAYEVESNRPKTTS